MTTKSTRIYKSPELGFQIGSLYKYNPTKDVGVITETRYNEVTMIILDSTNTNDSIGHSIIDSKDNFTPFKGEIILTSE